MTTSYRADLGAGTLGGRWFLVEHDPAGWPERHNPVNGYMGDQVCPGLPVWRVERTGLRGRPTGYAGYYCDGDLPPEFRRTGSAS